jgi:hypothetical protein
LPVKRNTIFVNARPLLLAVILALGGIGVSMASAVAAPTSSAVAFVGVHLHKTASNECLVARIGPGERPVDQTPCAGFSDQGWAFDAVFRNGEWVNEIRNVDRNLCLVTRGTVETPAVVSTCDAQFADQLWRAFSFSNGTWRFQNVDSRLCLVARNTSPATQTTCADFSDQFWLLD